MSKRQTLLEKLAKLVFDEKKSKKHHHHRKRSLGIETLEARELLTVVGFSSVQDAVEGSSTPGYFRLERDDIQGTLTVNYSLDWRNSADPYSFYKGWAKNGKDFSFLPGTNNWNDYGQIAFQDGERFVDISINAFSDIHIEGTENVRLELLSSNYWDWNNQSYTVNSSCSSAQLAIQDTTPSITVGIDSTQDGTEGGQNGFFRLRRDNTQSQITVYYELDYRNDDYASSPGWANSGYDFQRLSGYVVFAAGQEYADITVSVVDDNLIEGPELVKITLVPDEEGACGGGASSYLIDASRKTSTISIADNDTPPEVWIDSTQNAHEGGANGYFRLRRNSTTAALDVYYGIDTRNSAATIGWALMGSDFPSPSGDDSTEKRVTFAAGQEYVDIQIRAVDDSIVESDELIGISLLPRTENGLTPYFLSDLPEHQTSATLSIIDNDAAPNVWIDTKQNAIEGGGDGYFRLRRDNAQNLTTVKFELTGTAINGLDYLYTSRTVTFLREQKFIDIPINVRDDELVEYDETVVLTILPSEGVNDVPQYLLPSDSNRPKAAGIIVVDNDVAPKVWFDTVHNGIEGSENGFFRLRRDKTDAPLTVNYAIDFSNTTASYGIDFQSFPGMNSATGIGAIVFVVGEEHVDIPIIVIDDQYAKAPERVTLVLLETDRTRYTVDGSGKSTFNVLDTDFENEATPQAVSKLLNVHSGEEVFVNVSSPNYSVTVVGAPSHGSLITLADGTYTYISSDNYVGIDFFQYTIFDAEGNASNIATVSIAVTPTCAGTLLPTLDEELIPDIPDFDNTTTFGGTNFTLDPTAEFVPETIGTYSISSTTTQTLEDVDDPDAEEDDLETIQVMIVSSAYENGDFTYYEFVHWSYTQTTATGDVYSGYYEYLFYAWSIAGQTGYSYSMLTDDTYQVTTTQDTTTDSSSYHLVSTDTGRSVTSTQLGNWTDENGNKFAYENRIEMSTGKHTAEQGHYSHAVKGGQVEGALNESDYSLDYSETFLNMVDDGNGSWATSGTYHSYSTGISGNDYQGEGEYSFDETYDEYGVFSTAAVSGSITESGKNKSSHEYSSSGILSGGNWTTTGNGTSYSYDETKYLNDEEGTYTYSVDDGEYSASSGSADSSHYLDNYSVEREMEWNLVAGTWVVQSGRETETTKLEDHYKSSTEGDYQDGSVEGDYWDKTKSVKNDTTSLTRNLVAGAWVATEGEGHSYVYGKYEKGNNITDDEYSRSIFGGNIEGRFGSYLEELTEFEYDGSTSIVGGEWKLDVGEGFYAFDTETGDYYRGEGEYVTTSSVGGAIIVLNGTSKERGFLNVRCDGTHVKYNVEDGMWNVVSETRTRSFGEKYSLEDEATGTLVKAGDHYTIERKSKQEFSDWAEIERPDDPDSASVSDFETGTRTVSLLDSWNEKIEGENQATVPGLPDSTNATKKEFDKTDYRYEATVKYVWSHDADETEPNDDVEYYWSVESGEMREKLDSQKTEKLIGDGAYSNGNSQFFVDKYEADQSVVRHRDVRKEIDAEKYGIWLVSQGYRTVIDGVLTKSGFRTDDVYWSTVEGVDTTDVDVTMDYSSHSVTAITDGTVLTCSEIQIDNRNHYRTEFTGGDEDYLVDGWKYSGDGSDFERRYQEQTTTIDTYTFGTGFDDYSQWSGESCYNSFRYADQTTIIDNHWSQNEGSYHSTDKTTVVQNSNGNYSFSSWGDWCGGNSRCYDEMSQQETFNAKAISTVTIESVCESNGTNVAVTARSESGWRTGDGDYHDYTEYSTNGTPYNWFRDDHHYESLEHRYGSEYNSSDGTNETWNTVTNHVYGSWSSWSSLWSYDDDGSYDLDSSEIGFHWDAHQFSWVAAYGYPSTPMPTLSTMPGSTPPPLFVSGRDLPGSGVPLRKLDVNSPTLRSALDVGESHFASVEKFFELYGLQTLGDGDFQQVVERLAENNGKINSCNTNDQNSPEQNSDKIVEEEFEIPAAEDSVPGFDYEDMYETFFTKYGEEGVTLLLLALREGYDITKGVYSSGGYAYHPAWWIDGKTIYIGNTQWFGDYRTADDAADRLMYALQKVYDDKFGEQNRMDRERKIYDCLLGEDYLEQGALSRYYRFNAAWMLNSWVAGGVLKMENAWTGRSILDEPLSLKQRISNGAWGTFETFLTVVPVAKGVTAGSAWGLRALGVASIADTAAGKFLLADLTFKLGENTMKKILNTAAGQSMVKAYDKIYQSKYNITIYGYKKPPIGNIGVMSKDYVKPDGKLHWPDKPPVVDGFVDGTRHLETLQPGTVIDRFGSSKGTYASPENVPFADRGLPPGNMIEEYHRYKILKPLEVEAGTAAPWFNQPGGGVQYKLPDTIENLRELGYIEPIY